MRYTDVLVVFTGPVSCKTSSVTTRFVFLLTVCGTFPAQLGIENFGRISLYLVIGDVMEGRYVKDPTGETKVCIESSTQSSITSSKSISLQ